MTTKKPFTVIRPTRVQTGEELVDRAFEQQARSYDALLATLGLVTVFADVELADATTVTIRHGLGRPPRIRPIISAISGASTTGRVDLISTSSTEIQLEANGYGATVTVDVLVF